MGESNGLMPVCMHLDLQCWCSVGNLSGWAICLELNILTENAAIHLHFGFAKEWCADSVSYVTC